MIGSKCRIPLRRLVVSGSNASAVASSCSSSSSSSASLTSRQLFSAPSNDLSTTTTTARYASTTTASTPVTINTIPKTNEAKTTAAAAATQPLSSTSTRSFSTAPIDDYCHDEHDGYLPTGALFEPHKEFGPNMVGQKASIMRVFGPGANAQGLLTCGGEELARHASFDPDYERARGWIRNRAIGPAVLSPVLISGLVGALVEAAFPQSVPVSCSMRQNRPLIVGVDVCAKIEVTSVEEIGKDGETVSTKEHDFGCRQDGYCVNLKTEVIRVQDDAVIADGTHSVWVPRYASG